MATVSLLGHPYDSAMTIESSVPWYQSINNEIPANVIRKHAQRRKIK